MIYGGAIGRKGRDGVRGGEIWVCSKVGWFARRAGTLGTAPPAKYRGVGATLHQSKLGGRAGRGGCYYREGTGRTGKRQKVGSCKPLARGLRGKGEEKIGCNQRKRCAAETRAAH